jgi:hypothetical protein
MVHSGHEASAVDYNFSSLKGFMVTAMKYIFPPRYVDEDALKLLNEWPKAQHGPLVRIAAADSAAEEQAAELQGVSGE